MLNNEIILTGDRPTGPLHLGHYCGSLLNRVRLQEQYQQYILIADTQALTDNIGNIQKVQQNVFEVALDYLAVGIDPEKSSIILQSELPALYALTLLYMNFVSVAQLQHNPTIRNEIELRGFGDSIPVGFMAYPVAQAADITAFKATLIPVGEDQLPMIEQSNAIVKKINAVAKQQILPFSKALLSDTPRLIGVDGSAKMSKSSGNSIPLSANEKDIRRYVHSMYTDNQHLRVEDCGQIEGNVVFSYLDVFDTDKEALEDLKDHYRCGGLGDSKVKKRLGDLLCQIIVPIADRRQELQKHPNDVWDIIREGTLKGRNITEQTLDEVKSSLGLKNNLFDGTCNPVSSQKKVCRL
jgi:tryptophanyl-tRNA synthetase